MDVTHIPFSTIGIKPIDGLRITEAVERIANEQPDTSVSVQAVSQTSGFHPNEVKNVLYLLLSYRKLKATFLPVHKKCGNALSKPELSVEKIKDQIRRGDIRWCVHCNEPLQDNNEVDIQIIFWRLGANVS